MTGELGAYIVFLLGILVGGILFNKDFRIKFFKGLRGFLSGVGKGARQMNEQYSRGSSNRTRAESRSAQSSEYVPAPRREPKPKVIDCPTCDGVGKVQEELSPLMKGAPGAQEKWGTCPTCEGSGRVYEK